MVVFAVVAFAMIGLLVFIYVSPFGSVMEGCPSLRLGAGYDRFSLWSGACTLCLAVWHFATIGYGMFLLNNRFFN